MKKKQETDKTAAVETTVVVPEQMEPLNDRDLLLKPVNSWRTYIRRLLNEDGSYKRKYTYQVALAAQSMKLLQECYLEIMRLPEGGLVDNYFIIEGENSIAEMRFELDGRNYTARFMPAAAYEDI